MTFSVNDFVLAGTEGDKVTSRVIRDRLMREAEGNVALRVEAAPNSDAESSGSRRIATRHPDRDDATRGISSFRSPPRVVFQRSENGETSSRSRKSSSTSTRNIRRGRPEDVRAEGRDDRDEAFRRQPSASRVLRPTRGLIGYQGELLTDTRYGDHEPPVSRIRALAKGRHSGRRNGVLISNEQGEAVAYAMWKLEDRGPMMIEPGWKVYRGMIVGEHTRDNDLEINA